MFFVLTLLLMIPLLIFLLCGKKSVPSRRKPAAPDPVGPSSVTSSLPVNANVLTPQPQVTCLTPGLSDNSSTAVKKQDPPPLTPPDDKSVKRKPQLKEAATLQTEEALPVESTINDNTVKKNDLSKESTEQTTARRSAARMTTTPVQTILVRNGVRNIIRLIHERGTPSNRFTLAATKDGASEREGSAKWFKSSKSDSKEPIIENTQKSIKKYH